MRTGKHSVKSGDIEIHNGDALIVLQSMAGESIDAIITDPPYSSGMLATTGRTQGSTGDKYTTGDVFFTDFHGDNKDQRSFGFWMTMWLIEAYRVMKNGTPICLFTDWRQIPIMSDALQAAGFTWRGIVVWDKKNARPAKGRFRQSCEFVIWASKGNMPDDLRGVGYLKGMFTCTPNKGGRFHQTGKPVELMKEVCAVCEPDGVILDPFMGSGSTGVAAMEIGRKFVGIEYTRNYFNVSANRMGVNIPPDLFDDLDNRQPEPEQKTQE